jgi:hypothetical protein
MPRHVDHIGYKQAPLPRSGDVVSDAFPAATISESDLKSVYILPILRLTVNVR